MKSIKFLLVSFIATCWSLGVSAQTDMTGAPLPETSGEYYVYNVYTERYLGRGCDWGTRASLDMQGLPWNIEKQSDGTYTLANMSIDNHALGYLFNDGNNNFYVDNTTAANRFWTFTPVEGLTNTFTLKDNLGRIIRIADNDEYVMSNSSLSATPVEKYYWILIPRAEREDITNASPTTPADMTYLIYNQSMNHYEGEAFNSGRGHWTFAHDGGNINYRGGTANTYNTCMEIWNANSFDISQTLTGLESGKYRLTIQGFYRTGGNGNDAYGNMNERIAGTEETINAYFYANNVSEKFPSIFDSEIHSNIGSAYVSSGQYDINGTIYYIPTTMDRASKCFEAGYYNKSLEVVVTDGTLTIGARCDVANAGQWAIFDNFRLEYLGESLEDYENVLAEKIAEATTLYDADEPMNSGVKNALAAAISDAQTVLSNTSHTKEQLQDAVSSLNTAIDNATQSIADYAATATAFSTYATLAANLDAAGQGAYNTAVTPIQTEYDGRSLNENKTDAVKDAYIAAIKAQTTPGSDMTSAIVNPGFEESPWGKGWEGCGTGAAWDGLFVRQSSTRDHFNGQFAEMWGWFPDNTLYQTVTGLHNGYYKVEAYAVAIDQIDNTRTPIARFFAQSGELASEHEFANDEPAQLQTEVVKVLNGEITFGLEAYYSNGDINHNTWVAVDNWKLTFLGYNKIDVNIGANVNYGTLICPFDIVLPEGLVAYSCDETSGESLVLEEIADTLHANTPAILYSENGIDETFYGTASGEEEEEYTQGYLTGVYFYAEAPDNSYVLQKHGDKVMFYLVDVDDYQPIVAPYRCYLTLPTETSIKAFGFNFNTADAIKRVDLDLDTDAVYNLAGQKVDENYKGIIIRNGKKYINK